jgi:hypothetical protein
MDFAAFGRFSEGGVRYLGDLADEGVATPFAFLEHGEFLELRVLVDGFLHQRELHLALLRDSQRSKPPQLVEHLVIRAGVQVATDGLVAVTHLEMLMHPQQEHTVRELIDHVVEDTLGCA